MGGTGGTGGTGGHKEEIGAKGVGGSLKKAAGWFQDLNWLKNYGHEYYKGRGHWHWLDETHPSVVAGGGPAAGRPSGTKKGLAPEEALQAALGGTAAAGSPTGGKGGSVVDAAAAAAAAVATIAAPLNGAPPTGGKDGSVVGSPL